MDKLIGQAMPRLEDVRLVAGKGQYTDDIDLPGQAYAAFLRSSRPHAEIRAMDLDAARAAPGVLAVLTGQDYLADGYRGMDHVPNPADAIAHLERAFVDSLTGEVFNQRHLPLPVDKIRHVGEAVVMVIAETSRQARDAVERIEIDYEPLPAVVDADKAMLPGAPQLWAGAANNLCFQVQLGDKSEVERIFRSAHHVVRREFRNSRIVNCQMEPRSAIGSYDSTTQEFLLVSGSQGVVRQKMCIADALMIAPARLRVVCPDVGGGFGPRSMVNPEQLCVLWGSRRVGRPVKWTSDRNEAFLSDYQGRDQVARAAIAFARDGKILAVDNELIGNVGAHTVSYVPLANGSRIMTTVYDVPVAAALLSGVLTNSAPTGPYRGAGRPESTHVMERMLDIAADELGLDRIEIRRRNLIQPEQMPYRSPMGLNYDSGAFAANMERAVVVADWQGASERRAEALARGRLLGIGLANYIESPVGAPRERIELTISEQGRVDLVAGTQTTGQGHATTFAQVLADYLGVPFACITLRTGDSAFVSVGGGTHSDRSMRLVGTLIVNAVADLIDQGKPVAAAMFECDVEHVTFRDGAFHDDSAAGRALSLFDIAARIARDGRPGQPELKRFGVDAEFNGRMAAHPTGAAVCELEIDPETGDVALTRYTSIDDVGTPINPLIVEGQVHGGLAQGIGQALYEGFMVDPESGQVMSGSYMDYGVARAGALPPLSVELTLDPTSGNPLGVKGGGESGITPATATIYNALADALSAITKNELPMPATAAAIWQAIHQGEKR